VIVPRAVYRAMWAFHRGLRRVSGGRIGTRPPSGDGAGTLFLHTVGHKSGQPRSNGLYYLEEGENLVVVASNAGADRDPAWWLNLLAHPEAQVEIGGVRRPVRARPATTDEAARLVPRLDRANADFVTYRARVTRPIPIVILEPR
jgi:deazaflavin-dependent oxidoreductase (nitroreductase family)